MCRVESRKAWKAGGLRWKGLDRREDGRLGDGGQGCARRAKQKWNTRRHWRPASQRAEGVDVVEGMNAVDGGRRDNTQGDEKLSSVAGIRRYREDMRDRCMQQNRRRQSKNRGRHTLTC